MTDAYIYDAVRTPRGRGKKDGSLHEITGLQLATQVLEAVRDRNELDTGVVDDVVLGCVSPVGELGADIARSAVINANYEETVSGVQVNRFCASGLEACNMAAAKVKSGEADFAIGGGVEAMSRVPMGADGGAIVADPELAFDHYLVPQGVSADLIATKYGFSRDDCDGYAVESQRRAAAAWQGRRFDKSVVPVKDQLGLTALDHDEHMRPGTDTESLGKLKPSFKDLSDFIGLEAVAIQRYPEIEALNFVHHAGNSSGIVDGAAAVLIGSKEAGDKAGLKPRARIRAAASIGSEPTIMLTAPAASARKALAKAGMSVDDVDLFEMNEAFASVVLRFMQDLGAPHEKTNVNGGAIALGHPLGATGAMILGTLLDELERTDKSTGLATLCVGGGMGTATIIERI
ncbi:MAG: acetyl-CoA C-acetyltransferase [Caulobacterales bacterium]|nr:acetyl-CoA C-acetyltransferase [Caulobacterales bacterium]